MTRNNRFYIALFFSFLNSLGTILTEGKK